MKNRLLLAVLLSSVLAFGSIAQADILVQSTFDTGNDGWVASGDVMRKTKVGTLAPDTRATVWQATGGDPGGCLSNKDTSIGGTWYWVAPAKFLGDMTSAIGGTLSYDMEATHQGNWKATDLLLEGGNTVLQLTASMGKNPGKTWTHYDISLVPTGWYNKTDGRAATDADFAAVMGNLTEIWIRGEFWNGPDLGHLDNVIIQTPFAPEPASAAMLVLGGLCLLRRRKH